MKHPAREPLLWQNGFFGLKIRHKVQKAGSFKAVIAPSISTPEILDVVKYVLVPESVQRDIENASYGHKVQ